jgi:hypothetical protein
MAEERQLVSAPLSVKCTACSNRWATADDLPHLKLPTWNAGVLLQVRGCERCNTDKFLVLVSPHEAARQSTHVHVCIDKYDGLETCALRGFCICLCGARTPFYTDLWKEPVRTCTRCGYNNGDAPRDVHNCLKCHAGLPSWVDESNPKRVNLYGGRYTQLQYSRARGTCYALATWHGRSRLPSNQPQLPASVKLQVMRSKAYAFLDGYYVAVYTRFPEAWSLPKYERDRVLMPTYEQVRNCIVDGDGFDDEAGSGDYVLACRVALEVTRDRYKRVI